MGMPTLRIEISEADGGARLDAVLARAGGLPRSRAAELVSAGAVTVDGRVEAKAYRVGPGQVVEASIEAVPEAQRPPPPEVPVVYEDDDLLVVDKPSGLVVHGAPGLREATLVDALAPRPLAGRGGQDRPGIVHRLDRDVSGLLVVAKTDTAHEGLVDAMAQRKIKRNYVAAVAGVPGTDRGTIDAPVGRHTRHRTRMTVLASGKPAVTHFRVAERLGPATLLDVELETGRTHQIRTHLEAIGLPILGDEVYGADLTLARRVGLSRPFLHAARLRFTHPVTGREMSFEAPLPPDLARVLDDLRREAG
jgi:23S rRNA pseudouridine1911/1915/1917 synthase